jgi:hypothetical protein
LSIKVLRTRRRSTQGAMAARARPRRKRNVDGGVPPDGFAVNPDVSKRSDRSRGCEF